MCSTFPVHHTIPDRKILIFYIGELLAPWLNPKLEDHAFSAVRNGLFIILTAALHIRRPITLTRHLRLCQAVVAVVTDVTINVTVAKVTIVTVVTLVFVVTIVTVVNLVTVVTKVTTVTIVTMVTIVTVATSV
jgi:hypothetical protein